MDGTVEAVLWMLHPRWLATHLLLMASCTAMVLLGRWQWDVAGSGGSGSGSLLNYGYAVQWWLFTAFAIFFWVRLLRDRVRRASGRAGVAGRGPTASESDRVLAHKSAPYRIYAMPQAAQIYETDPELAAYNAYLNTLNPAAPVGPPGPPDPGSPSPDRTGPDRTGPDRTGPDRPSPNRPSPNRPSPNRPGKDDRE